MKYIYQSDGYSCSPIAIMNSLIHLGIEIRPQRLSTFSKLCRTLSIEDARFLGMEEGTFADDFEKALKVVKKGFPVKIKKLIKPSIKNIDECLKKEKIFIACGHDGVCEHFFLIVGKEHKKYKTINYYAEDDPETVEYYLTPKELKETFKRSCDPLTWLIWLDKNKS